MSQYANAVCEGSGNLSSRLEEIASSVADLRFFVAEFHDRLVGPMPSETSEGKALPMPAPQFDQMHIRLNSVQFNINEIRTMIRNIGGRI